MSMNAAVGAECRTIIDAALRGELTEAMARRMYATECGCAVARASRPASTKAASDSSISG